MEATVMAARASEHVSFYGLCVNDTELYAQYRRAMEPILLREGGRFGYDFVVSAVLRSEVEAPINRVFSMVFPSIEVKQRFFERADYLRVRSEFFERAVGSVTQLAAFDVHAM
jgi:uncharacterized protein (DUF1330 family)